MDKLPENVKRRIDKMLALVMQQDDKMTQAIAEAQLKVLMKKYDLTLEELIAESEAPEEIVYEDYKFQTEPGKQLIFQVLHKVTDGRLSTYKAKGRTVLKMQATKTEHKEAKIMLTLYFKAWKEFLKNSMQAFIYKNNIYPETRKTPVEDLKPLTAEEHAHLDKIIKLSEGMDVVPVHKLLTSN